MSSQEPESPEVQRAGFEEVVKDVLSVDPKAIESFFEDDHPEGFDPSVPFVDNVANFRRYMEAVGQTLSGVDEEKLREIEEESG